MIDRHITLLRQSRPMTSISGRLALLTISAADLVDIHSQKGGRGTLGA
ncbi:MAG: hypothetical protein H6643_02960 [Caldilineaceae bacterium]|nr:hypothetical protein [Caldilineaceae bacterium]